MTGIFENTLLSQVADIAKSVVANLFPDPVARSQAEAEVYKETLARQQQIYTAAAEIVKAEAQSEHWLTSSWRPTTMLVFVGLIVARWLGWASPGLSEAEYLKLWDIVELGLGGYTVGRSVEKIVPTLADAIGQRQKPSNGYLPYKG